MSDDVSAQRKEDRKGAHIAAECKTGLLSALCGSAQHSKSRTQCGGIHVRRVYGVYRERKLGRARDEMELSGFKIRLHRMSSEISSAAFRKDVTESQGPEI